MATEVQKICFDRIVPPEFTVVARERAIAENPANASPFEAAAVRSKLWKPGRKLRINFLDGLSEVQGKVRRFAKIWMDHANIEFDFGEYANAEIRISFKQKGSWSALGTDALVEEYFARDEATMNYGWLHPETHDDEYSSVVLHEFGHALGMIHEHQNPSGGIQWSRAAVIRDLSGYPNYWDQQTIEFNMFERYEVTQTQFTKFDPKSIMLYAFPKEWTLNGMEYPRNTVLSETDMTFISVRYPRSGGNYASART